MLSKLKKRKTKQTKNKFLRKIEMTLKNKQKRLLIKKTDMPFFQVNAICFNKKHIIISSVTCCNNWNL